MTLRLVGGHGVVEEFSWTSDVDLTTKFVKSFCIMTLWLENVHNSTQTLNVQYGLYFNVAYSDLT